SHPSSSVPFMERVGDLLVDQFPMPVHLLVAQSASHLQRLMAELLAVSHIPFVVLVPTASSIEPEWLAATRERGHEAAPRDRILARSSRGAFVMVRELRAAVRSFMDRHVPAASRKPVAAVFLPEPGTTWAQVIIRFVDAETIAVTVGTRQQELTFAQ